MFSRSVFGDQSCCCRCFGDYPPKCITGQPLLSQAVITDFLPDFTDFLPILRTFLGELDSRLLEFLLTCNHLGLFARLITSFSTSSMVLLQHARAFFRLFLGSRNHKIQIGVQVGRKSAVELSGVMEASYCHFFIGLDFDRSRE